MTYSVSEESFASLIDYFKEKQHNLKWDPLFMLPPWLHVWWQEFGCGHELLLLSVRKGENVIGVAPLKIKENTASVIGSSDVSDYVDFIISPGWEENFFATLLAELKKRSINYLDIQHFKPESRVACHLVGMAKRDGHQIHLEPNEMTLELSLHESWDKYLGSLSKKERHEVRRKIRRLEEAGETNYRVISENKAVLSWLDTFLRLFRESRQDKETYMTPRRESFFRSMTSAMAKWDLLKIGVLEIDAQPAAIIVYFDYDNKILLYNSSYDPRFRHLSAGLLSKVFCIKDSINKKREIFDFLKGNEAYKYRLGGSEVPLFRCCITIN